MNRRSFIYLAAPSLLAGARGEPAKESAPDYRITSRFPHAANPAAPGPYKGQAVRVHAEKSIDTGSARVDRATDRGADLMWRRLMPLLYSDEANYDASHVGTVVKA